MNETIATVGMIVLCVTLFVSTMNKNALKAELKQIKTEAIEKGYADYIVVDEKIQFKWKK